MDRAEEFLEDLQANWDNAYWWADHQLLQTAIACVVIGVVGLTFKYCELRLEQQMGVPHNG